MKVTPRSNDLYLLVFESKGVDIAGPYIAKQERRVGGIQPEPQSEGPRIFEVLQADNNLCLAALDRDPKDGRIICISKEIKEAAIRRPVGVGEETFING